jgi:hypothetical protein
MPRIIRGAIGANDRGAGGREYVVYGGGRVRADLTISESGGSEDAYRRGQEKADATTNRAKIPKSLRRGQCAKLAKDRGRAAIRRPGRERRGAVKSRTLEIRFDAHKKRVGDLIVKAKASAADKAGAVWRHASGDTRDIRGERA